MVQRALPDTLLTHHLWGLGVRWAKNLKRVLATFSNLLVTKKTGLHMPCRTAQVTECWIIWARLSPLNFIIAAPARNRSLVETKAFVAGLILDVTRETYIAWAKTALTSVDDSWMVLLALDTRSLALVLDSRAVFTKRISGVTIFAEE